MERGKQAAEHPSQKERGLWGCSQGYRAKPGSVERQSEGRGEGRERERETDREREKEKWEGGQCRYREYEWERETACGREQARMQERASESQSGGGEMREQ